MGALFVALGLALAGSGMAYAAYATAASYNCAYAPHGTDCSGVQEASQNASVAAGYLLAVGTILAGVGFAVFALAVIETLHRRRNGPVPPSISPR